MTTELVAAEIGYAISVAIERQQQARGGIDAVAYGLLLNAQTRLEQLSSQQGRRRGNQPGTPDAAAEPYPAA